MDSQGRSVEVFDPLGNVRPELLMGNVGVDVTVGSGEPSPESSVHGSDQGESFAFGVTNVLRRSPDMLKGPRVEWSSPAGSYQLPVCRWCAGVRERGH